MREILFRGKRADNGEWVDGDHFRDPDLETDEIIGYQYYTDEEGPQREPYCHRVIPETVGQYTGIEDENGRQICEGNIVWCEADEEYGEVEWDKDTARFVVRFSTFIADFDNLYGYEVEIVGNAYDNPELIGGEHR